MRCRSQEAECKNSAAQYSVLLLCYVVDYSSPSLLLHAFVLHLSSLVPIIIILLLLFFSLCRSAKKKNEKKVHMVADLGLAADFARRGHTRGPR